MIKQVVLKIIAHYRHNLIPRWLVLALDMLMFVAAFLLSKALARDLFVGDYRVFIFEFLTLGFATIVSFLVFGTFKGMLRHSGMSDAYRVFLACAVPVAICWIVNYFCYNFNFINVRFLVPYRVSFMTYAILFACMMMFRMLCQRVYNDVLKHRRPEKNIVIYGAGAAGMITASALSHDQLNEYRVVAYIDDDELKIGQRLNNAPVLGVRTVLSSGFIKKREISELIIAVPGMRTFHKRAITSKALDLGLKVKSVPHINTWIDGSFGSNQIEEIKIEDLLGRESIKLDSDNVRRHVEGKVVMVTGAAGSIGSEIARQLLRFGTKQVIMLDQAESPMYDFQFELKSTDPYRNVIDKQVFVIANVKDQARMEEVFATYKPQIIYHAAAYKHVPFMEENPYEAVLVNVFGTKNLADLAIKYEVEKFVMISTDKAVNPTNVMGATKRMAEIYIQCRSNEKTSFVTTRFGNVLGSNGSVIPLFKKQLAAGGPLTVTDKKIIRYFMTIPEACSLVLEAAAMGVGGDIFVFDMGKPVKIYDLAHRMIQLSGLKDIEIKEIGLRPGEKLYEELLATKENTIPTNHEKIMHAQVRTYDINDVDREYAELRVELDSLEPMRIVAKMKSIVPEFVSNNSVYCQLDKPKEE